MVSKATLTPVGWFLTLIFFCFPCSRAQASRYSTIESRVRQLDSTPSVEVLTIGKSVEGRPLLAVVLTGNYRALSELSQRPRVLVVAGQHGNEPTPVAAAVELIETLACDKPHSPLLDKAVLVFVPAANPDGLEANLRTNVRGVDLNRDWKSQSQPETAAIARLLKDLQPDLVLDLHEWTARDSRASNCVEMPKLGRTLASRLSRGVAESITAGCVPGPMRLNRVEYTDLSNDRLLHRWLTSSGIASLLVETAPSISRTRRHAIYANSVMSAVRCLTAPETPSVRLLVRKQLACYRSIPESLASLGQPANPIADCSKGLVWWVLASSAGLIALLVMQGRQVDRHQNLRPGLSKSPRSQPFTDLVCSGSSIRSRLELMKNHRTRPSDRAAKIITATAG